MIDWPKFTGKQIIDLKLDRTRKLLARLGHPEKQLKNVIHVAGTNGKGSTIAFLRSFLNANNYTTNIYTSPHLVRFNERIVTQNTEISDTELDEILTECALFSATPYEINPTFFEGTTVAALLAFAKKPADYNLIEVGLGGRLDSTNIFDQKLAAIITHIDLDHTELLGDSLSKIAREKIAISKGAKHIIIAKQKTEAFNSIKEFIAQHKLENVKFYQEDYSFSTNDENFIYTENNLKLEIPLNNIPLIGAHQHINLATAIATILAISTDKEKSLTAIKNGITKCFWPARMQKINFFSNLIAKSSEIYLDGGHNINAATALADWLKQQKQYKKVKLFFTMAEDKNAEDFLQIISPYINEIHSYIFPHERNFHSHAQIADIAEKLGVKALKSDRVEDFLQKDEENTLYLICGSLFLAGEILRQNLRND